MISSLRCNLLLTFAEQCLQNSFVIECNWYSLFFCENIKMSDQEYEFELSDEDDDNVSDCTISDLENSSDDIDDDSQR